MRLIVLPGFRSRRKSISPENARASRAVVWPSRPRRCAASAKLLLTVADLTTGCGAASTAEAVDAGCARCVVSAAGRFSDADCASGVSSRSAACFARSGEKINAAQTELSAHARMTLPLRADGATNAGKGMIEKAERGVRRGRLREAEHACAIALTDALRPGEEKKRVLPLFELQAERSKNDGKPEGHFKRHVKSAARQPCSDRRRSGHHSGRHLNES